ncbi:hypothetical protein [Ruoffia tabacinasalis]|uniref:hypothetical protein n=1 Tax=Ruoffia tabacinasalis TaxID=87458 RepID=UPI0030CC8D14
MDLLEQSLRKAFINRKEIGSQYDPKLIINQLEKKECLLNNLQDETEKCVSFIFSISVIVILVILNIIGALDLPMGVVFHEGSTRLVILNGLRLLAERDAEESKHKELAEVESRHRV